MNNFGEVVENVSLKDYSTFGIGGVCKYLIKPFNENSLIELLKHLKFNNIKYFLLGNGSNVILDDNYFDGVIIILSNLNSFEIKDNIVIASSGVMINKLANATMQNGLTSLSFAAMIPGNVGGSVVGNAGAYGDEIMNYVRSVKVLNKNYEIKTIDIEDINYGYRWTSLKDNYVVLEATFVLEKGDVAEELLVLKERNEKRMASQPLDKKSVGSIFRNPEGTSAGKIIDDLGLKGFQIGGAKISEKHANFIVNENDASFDDVINLINHIKNKVSENYNLDLIVEPTVVKWDDL